jgi:hypothetical protein
MDSNHPNRRWLVTAGAACFAGMSTSAIAQDIRRAQLTGRPIFTADAFNRMVPAAGRERRTFLTAFASDPRGFVRGRFTLNAQQEAELVSIPDSEIANLQGLLRRAARTSDALRMEITSTPSGEGQSKFVVMKRLTRGVVAQETTLHLNTTALIRPDAPAIERLQRPG